MKPLDIPGHIDTIDAVHHSQQPLYEFNAASGGYALSPAGRQLQRLRKAIIASPSLPDLPRPAPGKAPVLQRQDWMVALSCATPSERRHLLQACGRGDLIVKG